MEQLATSGKEYIGIKIHYSKSSQSKLITECIQKILSEHEKDINYSLVYISNFKGEQLKLVICVKAISLGSIYQQFHSSLQEFLKQNPSPAPRNNFIPGKDLWMHYSNNSFLCEVLTSFPEDWYTDYCIAISKVMIYDSLPFVNDDENTIAEAMLLHFCLCSVFPDELCRKIYSFLFSYYEGATEANIEHEFYFRLKENANSFVQQNRGQLDNYRDNETIEGNFGEFRDLANKILLGNSDEKVIFSRYLQLQELLQNHYGIEPMVWLYLLNIMKSYFNERSTEKIIS
ncbi:hypothetical protein [Parapedobacter koreensis]|uniref:Uncharacterized protein n=1 Tax=Parapedobacter koreensis TaxID=332977 RepID=A0A1H7ITL5_9SPHI|nr:hypothetical protein [Parapedobacter koreensis]SEK65718.1 hypothetical protein SAMN05421740_102358 [Parapedobacter koreensis]